MLNVCVLVVVSERREDLSRTVFVSGLGLDVSEESLQSYLEQFGPVKAAFLVKNKATGKPKGKELFVFSKLCFVSHRNRLCGVF